MTPPKQETNRASKPRELEAVLQEVAALGEPDVWDEKVKWRLCEQARLVRDESGMPGFDSEVSSAIRKRQRQLVRKQVRELMVGTDDLQDLYLSSVSPARRWVMGGKEDRVEQIWDEVGSRITDFGERDALSEKDRKREDELLKELESYAVDWRRRASLENLLADFLYAYHKALCERPPWRNPLYRFLEAHDHDEDWTFLLEPVHRYLTSPWMRTPWLTNYLVLCLLDRYLIPAAGIVADRYVHYSFKRPMIIVGGLGLGLMTLGVGFMTGFLPWGAWQWGIVLLIWCACLVPWMVLRLVAFLRAKRALKRLQPIYDEVRSGLYDREEITRRLRQTEGKGVYFPTLLYALLRQAPGEELSKPSRALSPP